MDIEISSYEEYILDKVDLYNLSVDSDESYLAKGIAVHNCSDTHPHCLCTLLSIYIPDTAIQDPWTRPSPYDQPYTQDELANISGGFRV